MTIKVQPGVGLAVGILALISGIAGLVMGAAQRFAALDTRLGKLESAIKTLNAMTPDDRYKQLVKELIAEERSDVAPKKANAGRPFGGNSFPADAGAAANMPSTKPPQ